MSFDDVQFPVAKKVYDLDTLRQPAYSDKERSKTRMIFTLTLFGGAIACFIILFVYKGSNRSSIIKTEDSPNFAKFLSLNKTYSSTLSCTAKAAVYYTDVNTGPSPSDIYDAEVPKCRPDTGYTYEQYAACEGGGYTTYHALRNYQFAKGFILTPVEITDAINNIVQNSPQQLDDLMYTVYYSIYHGIVELIDSGDLVGNSTNVYNRYKSVDPNLYDSGDKFYVMTDGFITGLFDDNGAKVNYQAYYEAAKVGTCTYTAQEGWFDVFIFAVNSTQSLFSATVIILGFLYGGVKSYQSSKKVQNEVDLKQLEEPTTDQKEENAEIEKPTNGEGINRRDSNESEDKA